MLLLLLLQASAQAPDIELNATVRARQVTIEKKGDASLTVRTEPDGGGNVVDVRAPKANGRKTLRNVEVDIRAEARIADPGQVTERPEENLAPETETEPPQ